jgi:hypothetical protein
MTTARRIETARGGHRYELEGVRVPGVTSIIGAAYPKPWLKPWALKIAANYAVDSWDELSALEPQERVLLIKRAPDAHRNSRGDFGRDVHSGIEALLTNGSAEAQPDVAEYVAGVAAWLDSVQPVVLASECSVYSTQYGYAGTFDAVLSIDGVVWLVDWKTSPVVSTDYALQLAAYRYADLMVDSEGTESPMIEVERCGVVHVLADSCSLVPVDAGPDAFSAFLSCMALYDVTSTDPGWVGVAL